MSASCESVTKAGIPCRKYRLLLPASYALRPPKCSVHWRGYYRLIDLEDWSACVISLLETVVVRGSPVTWSRPRTGIVISSWSGIALPIVILTSSAVRSPMTRLWRRLM